MTQTRSLVAAVLLTGGISPVCLGSAIPTSVIASAIVAAIQDDHGRAVVGVYPSGQAGGSSAPRYPGAPVPPAPIGPAMLGGSAPRQSPSGQTIPPGSGQIPPIVLPGDQAPPPPGVPGATPSEPAPTPPSPTEPGAGEVPAPMPPVDTVAPEVPSPTEPGAGTTPPEAGAEAGPIDTGAPDITAPTTGAPDLGPGLDVGALSAAEAAAGLSSATAFGAPEVMGDSPGLSRFQLLPGRPNPPPVPPQPPVPPRPPVPPTDVAGIAFVPSIRLVKISENQSPIPTDRILYDFNYFNNVNYAINQRFLSPISNIGIYRHILGFEKTIFGPNASFGVRFPINTITADSPIPGIGGNSTAINTTNVFFKWAFYRDDERKRLFSTGMSIGIPTGPARFAGASYLDPFNVATLQPFLGSLFYGERWFFQGFSFLEIPMDKNAPTILFNDYALGYYIYKDAKRERFLTGVAPLFEVHVTTPLSHRGVRLSDPQSVPDIVNFTYGVSWEFGKRTRLMTGITTPVTGPRPFDFEAQCILNVYF
jgi:hypothetical protein